MRILVLSDLWVPFPGGAERMMQNISFALKQRGAEVSVLTFYRGNARSEGGIPVKGLAIRGDTPHDAQWTIIRDEIEHTKPGVILTHQLFPDKFRAELPSMHIPIVQVVHAAPKWPYVVFAVYNSGHTMLRNSNRSPEDMIIYPPAFEDCKAPHHGQAIGFIKPVEHKGVELIYKLAARLSHRHFVILRGEWWHFDQLVDLPNVEYMAPVDNIRDFYKRCHIVLVPSLTEDAGTVPQEAAMNLLPCISSDAGGLRETNAAGIILKVSDPDSWVNAIEELYTCQGCYSSVTGQQKEHLIHMNWPQRFDELYARMARL